MVFQSHIPAKYGNVTHIIVNYFCVKRVPYIMLHVQSKECADKYIAIKRFIAAAAWTRTPCDDGAGAWAGEGDGEGAGAAASSSASSRCDGSSSGSGAGIEEAAGADGIQKGAAADCTPGRSLY